MKTLLIISLFLFLTTLLNAQKVRLEGDDSKYLCLNDSIAETFEVKLKKTKVDSTISILYDYDNGRLPNSIRVVIWTHNGISNIRLVQGCDKIYKDTTFTYNLTDLWKYIKTTHFDDVTVPIKSGTGQSHDKFYHITVTTSTKSFFVVVRDNERKKSEKYKTPESDTRVMLTNKIDDLLK
jgi:predicted RND superfamily exporter protein